MRGTGNQGAKTTRNQAIRYAAGYCRILPEIAGNCMRGRGDQILPDIAGYCRILPDFAGFCKNIAGYCRTLPDETSGKVRQRSAIFGNNGFAGYCQILPADCRKLLTTPALWFLCARYLARIYFREAPRCSSVGEGLIGTAPSLVC